jgi:hypothetical protein
MDRPIVFLDTYFGMAFELFSKSQRMPGLRETFSKLARTRVREYRATDRV